MIRKTIQEFSSALSGEDYSDISGKSWDKPKLKGQHVVPNVAGFSSKEAKSIMDKETKRYSKTLKKATHTIIGDMLKLVKSGKVDYFDVMRGVSIGPVGRIDPHESEFIQAVLHKNKVEDRFRSYLKGKKSLPTRKWR